MSQFLKMINHQVIIALVLVFGLKNAASRQRNLHPDAGLDINQLTSKYGYPLESHEVQTEDGYILTMHRIPHATNSSHSSPGPPVFLMHALLCSSVDWINLGPGNALALLLADNGYDVWMGNQRGNRFSRKHITLDPDQDAEKFFDFSFHEIGFYDVAGQIDYILNTTKQEQLVYVGFSQGTTTFFVLMSERPEYNKKIKLMSALGPVSYMSNIPNPWLKLLADEYDLLVKLFDHLKLHEFLPYRPALQKLGNQICSEGSAYQNLCVLALNLIAGFDTQVDPNFLPVVTSNTPAGSSVKQLLHYFQEIVSQNFAQFDYGRDENINHYGQDYAPKYDISKITAPVSLHIGKNDWLSSVVDVDRLAQQLPNLKSSKLVPWDKFNHLDFIWARDVATLVYKDVISEIKGVN